MRDHIGGLPSLAEVSVTVYLQLCLFVPCLQLGTLNHAHWAQQGAHLSLVFIFLHNSVLLCLAALAVTAKGVALLAELHCPGP